MGKKIAVITGSPRKKGNSFAMTDAFIDEAEALGHEVSRFDAAFANLNGCHGCMTCYKTGKPCSFDDDFNTFADKILEADVVIFTTPVYWYDWPGQIKNAIDNMFCFAVAHKPIKDKSYAIIACCQESDPTVFDHIVGSFARSAKLLNWDNLGNVLVTGVDELGDIKNTDGEERARELARRI